MALRFPYRKNRESTLSDITGFNGGNLQDQLDRTYSDGNPGAGFDYSSSAPPVNAEDQQPTQGWKTVPIPVPPVPARDLPPSSPIADDAAIATSAVDPAILASLTANARADAARPVAPSPEPAPIMVRHPGQRPGKSTRPSREGMIGAGNAEDANRAYGEAVDRYEPKAEPKWRRYLRIAAGVGGMFGGAFAHDSGTAERAALAVGANLADDKFIDKGWKAREQAEVDRQDNRYLGRRKAEATIANIEAMPNERAIRERRLQKGVDLRGQRVGDQKLNEGLSQFNRLKNYDPEDPKYAGLRKIFEDTYGLHDLPAKNDDKYDLKMVNGEYEWIPKKPGDVTTVTKDGKALIDPSRVADHSVKLPDGTVLDHLTPREAAAWEGKVYESAEDRKSRERIAAASQAGQNTRAAMRGPAGSPGGAINASVKGAVVQLSKFRTLTARIEKAKLDYGNIEGPAPDSHPAIRALYDQRDALERDMKTMYGKYLEMDENGKPKGLRDDAVQSSPGAGLTIEGAIERFKVKNKKAPNAKEIEKMQAALDAIQ